MIGWFTDSRLAWEIEFENLTYEDFKKLGIEKEKLYEILQQLYEWKIIR